MSYRILRAVVVAVAVILPLGLASVATAAAPVPTFTAIAAGYVDACAVASNGSAWCWGNNANGQLGDGTTTERDRAVPVTNADGGYLTAVTAITIGFDHACAVTRDGAAWCWGANANGQLGDGTTIERHRAVRVSRSPGGNLTRVTATSAAGWGQDHTCAVTDDGAAWCWGGNAEGQIGDGTTIERHRAVRVTKIDGRTLLGVTSISAGGFNTCAVTNDGAAWCWGGNAEGQIGDGTTTERTRAVRVTKAGGGYLSRVTAVSATGSGGQIEFANACAVTSDGAAWCWAGNSATEPLRAARVRKAGSGNLSGVTAISAGENRMCAISSGGVAWCWDVVFTCGTDQGCTSVVWNGAQQVTTADGGYLARLSAIAVGASHTCAIKSGGRVACWGDNYAGDLGDGTRAASKVPVDVVFPGVALPSSDTADLGADRSPMLPALPLLAGVTAGLAMMRRRWPVERDA